MTDMEIRFLKEHGAKKRNIKRKSIMDRTINEFLKQ